MRNYIAAGLIAVTGLFAQMSHALEFAVADSQAAVTSTNMYKSAVASLEAQIRPEKNRLDAVKKELEDMQQRYQRDEKVMSNDDKTKLRNQAQAKLNEYNSIGEGIQRRLEESESNLLKQLLPKLQKVIESIAKENGYKGIVEKKSMIWSDPSIDVTKQITDRLNQQQ